MEILVVTAIVAILAAILTSVTQRVIKSAKNAACMSNLASIHKGLALYGVDHDGNFPPYPLLSHAPWTPRQEEFKLALNPYGAVDSIFYCPLDEKARTNALGEWGTFEHMSYITSLETVFHATTYQDGSYRFNLSSVKDPSSFMLLLDHTFLLEDEEEGTRVRRSSHGERLSVVYGDGHTKSLPVPPP